ncbi:hypothetical protein CPB85DRAFT_1264229 [Mucidula mucida]|nr:hypothetical protein CPB85DRAFT_1264229 [Mucidula mucida]
MTTSDVVHVPILPSWTTARLVVSSPLGRKSGGQPCSYIQRAWAITNPAYGKIWAGFDGTLSALSSSQRPVLTPGLKRAFQIPKKVPTKKQSAQSGQIWWQGMCYNHLLEEILIMFSELAQQLVRQNSKGKQPRTVKKSFGGKTDKSIDHDKAVGATGDVFAATIPNVKHGPIVVKLATTFSRLCRLRHEYSVYAYLKSANVKCIPRVYGFYQDAHRCAGALILSNDGGPLGGRRAKLTADEKTRIRAAVSSIHAAGVLHRDLRTWNILVNDAGGISIIDFDRANTDAQDKDIQVEWERLEKLLKGKHVRMGKSSGKMECLRILAIL